MDFLDSLDPPDLQVTPVMAQWGRKVSQDSRDLKVALATPVSPAPGMVEPLGFAVNLESLVYLGFQGNQACLDPEAKCYLAPYLVRLETPDTPEHLDDQVLKVNQASQEDQDVQGLMEPKEREEIMAMEANLDHKVSLDPEEILEFPVSQDRALMEAEGRTVFPGVLEPKASLERSWEPHLALQQEMAYLEFLETRASLGPQADLDHLVLMDAQVSQG